MTELSVSEIPIAAIQVSDRYRKEFGDIAGLAASIESLGLLQPIGVDPDRRLVFGQRRLQVFKHLGRTTIPAIVIDVPAIVLAEHAENEIRKDFTVSERVEIGKAVETEQILHLIRDYGHHQRHQASQHTGAAQQMYLDKAAAARDIERKIVTLMGADHD